MTARIKIFLTKSPKGLSSAATREGIPAADLLTLGELFDIEEEAVRSFRRRLQWHDDPLGFSVDSERAVRIEQNSEHDYVRFLIDELRPADYEDEADDNYDHWCAPPPDTRPSGFGRLRLVDNLGS